MEIEITEVLVCFITLLTALVEIYAIPWIKSKISNAKLEQLVEFAKIGVQAAEQMMKDRKGEEKKAFVVEYLEAKGLHFDEETINAAIEAAVLEMNNALLK